MKPIRFLAIAIGIAAASRPAGAELIGVLVRSSTVKSIVRIDSSTGAATALGTSAIGGYSGGVSAVRSDKLRFLANATGETSRRLFTFDVDDGSVASQPVVSAPAGAKSAALVLFSSGANPIGLFVTSTTTKTIATIDNSTGATTTIGGALGVGRVVGGAGAFDSSGSRLFFVGQDSTGAADPGTGETMRIWAVNAATGSISSNPWIANTIGGSAIRTEPIALVYDATSSQLLGLFRQSASTTARLASINTSTGALTAVGSGFSFDAHWGGVYASDSGNRILYVAGRAPSETSTRIFGISQSTGALLSSPIVVPPGTDGSRPIALAFRSPGPGRSDEALKVTKSGSNYHLAWGLACGTQTDWAIYQGTIGTWTGHAPQTCTTGNSTSLDISTSKSNAYFLVVPLASSVEGSYGKDSSGTEIARSSSPCVTTQDLTGCP